MVKIFIGNLASETKPGEIRELFEKYGKVTECDVVKNYGFVHMSKMSEAEEAIKNLNQHELHGWSMNVELSKGKPRSTTKLHVSNLGESVSNDVLRAKFEEFGSVVECDIVKDYAFVHMERMEDAMEAINTLDNTAFKGKLINVQLSTSRLRTAPGMGDHNGCFVCGKHGHWSKDCPQDRNGNHGDGSWGRPSRGPPRNAPSYGGYEVASPSYGPEYGSTYSRASYASGLPPPPPPPPPPRRAAHYSADPYDRYASLAAAPRAAERPSVYDPHRLYSSINYYEQQRSRYYGSSYLDERRAAYAGHATPPPPPPSSYSYSKLPPSADPYSRRPVAQSAPPASSSYYARDYSALRQIPTTSNNYERTRLSPVSSAPRTSYALPPSKDHYAARYAPY